MMFRRVLSLMLVLQMLLTQLGQVHCHAGHVHRDGTPPHVHLSLPSEPLPEHHHGHPHRHPHTGPWQHGHTPGHSHGGDEEPGPIQDSEQSEGPCQGHEHDSDAYQLPDGWHAQRTSIRLVGGLLVIAFVPPDRLDYSRTPAGVGDAHCVPPDPEPPSLPVYLRTLRILV